MDSVSLDNALRELFGHPAFRDGQKEIVECVLAGTDVLAVLPTGGGKSLLYQLPAFLLPGATVAVSPLIALMKDQMDQLRARGLAAAVLNSSQDYDEQERILTAVARGEIKLLFVAPERFKSARFVSALSRVKVSLLAVDEAHCVSEWGHDFRPDYLRLGEAAQILGRPPILAVTATATEPVRKEIAHSLGLRPDHRVFVRGFDRPNLRFSVVSCSGEVEKEDAVKAAIARVKTGSVIVYAATRKGCERLSRRIKGAALYHAGLPPEQRRRAQDEWASGRARVVVATNAFGLGINKDDVRLVVHHDLTGSLEAYYQEAGRAGRDGHAAECVLLYSGADVHLQTFLTEGAFPDRTTVESVWRVLSARRGSDPGTIREAIAAHPSERAIGSALKLLVDAGHAREDRDEGFEPIETPFELNTALRIDWDRLERHRVRERERLDDMLRYARGSSCRRSTILRYFGAPLCPCGRCDRCEVLATNALPVDEAKLVARKVLSLVARLKSRFGRKVVARLLAGIVTKEDKDRELDTIPTVGALKPWSTEDCAMAVDACLGHGLLVTWSEDPKFPKLALTKLGVEVLYDRIDVPLALARPATTPAVAKRGKGGEGARKRRDKSPSLDAAAEKVAADPEILAALRNWRSARSKEEKVPPYCIFHDRTLEALAAKKPRDHVALLEVPGFGPKKAEKYGELVLSLVNSPR